MGACGRRRVVRLSSNLKGVSALRGVPIWRVSYRRPLLALILIYSPMIETIGRDILLILYGELQSRGEFE